MNLVYLSNAVIPSRKAHSIHVMKMCHSLTKAGASVQLITARREENNFYVKNPFEFYSVYPDFKIHKVQWFPRLPGKYYLFGLMSAFKSIFLKPDLIYGRYLFGVFIAALLGKSVIFESHSDEFNRGTIHKWMIRFLSWSKRCKKIVVISNALKEAYLNEFPQVKDKIIVAHDGADRMMPLKSNSSTKNDFTVGYVGSLYPGKGMEIVSELVKKCPDVQFTVAGGTEKDIQPWKSELSDHSNINFLGFIPHSDVHETLKQFDVLVAPYQRKVDVGMDIARWMSPLKIFEYMSAQKPIISSDLPVLREILVHRENAILCSPDNSEDWANAIYELRDNPDLRNELSVNAYREFEEKYTWDRRAKTILESLQ